MSPSSDSFVVATTHHLLLVRPSAAPEIMHTGDGMYSGLAWSDGRLYVSARRTVAEHDSLASRAAQRGCVLVFDESLELVESIEPPFAMRDVHGISVAEGRLWITCTFDDLVAVHDLAAGTWDRWYPSPDPAHHDKDINHLNTVAIVEGQLAVVAHRWGDSEVWLFDIDSRQLNEVRPLGYQAHDLFGQDGSLATCSSGEGLLRNARGWVVRTGGFPRGLARGDATTAVGISPVLARDDRAQATPSVRMYSPDWRLDREVALPGVGMVHSVAHLPQVIAPRRFRPLPVDPAVSRGSEAPADQWNVATAIAPQLTGHGWHGHEGNLRWSAARRATLPVVINPGETHLIIEALTYRPEPCVARIECNGRALGRLEWRAPGSQEGKYALPLQDRGFAELAVIVDELWQEPLAPDDPREPRRLGVGLVSLRFTS